MGNHTVDCRYCGEDTRGLISVRGCHTDEEAGRCGHYRPEQKKETGMKAADLERAQPLIHAHRTAEGILGEFAQSNVAGSRVVLVLKRPNGPTGDACLTIPPHGARELIEAERDRIAGLLREMGVQP